MRLRGEVLAPVARVLRETGRRARITLRQAAAPVVAYSTVLERRGEAKFPLFIPLAAAHDHEVAGPRQNSHQRCEFWKAAIHFVKVHHSPESRTQPRLFRS